MSNFSLCRVLFLSALCILGARELDAQDPDAQTKPFGIENRVPWTTSRILGTPEPPLPYRLRHVFPKLRFRNPVEMCPLPNSNRLIMVELHGNIYSFSQDEDEEVEKPDLFFALKKAVPEMQGVYGIAFDPKFADNRFVYICYVLGGTDPNGTRVSRFRVTDEDPPKVDPKSERILLTWLAGGHNGGCLKFGPDGYLYITSGDGKMPNPPDVLRTGQDCSDLLSSILRIDVHPANGDLPYAVPKDNPFIGKEKVRPEIWSFGYRNPWKMSFDSKTGDLWVGDVGWDLWELVFKVERGANYGWSVMEGTQPIHPDDPLGPAPISPPAAQHPHSEARSITGGYVYRGKAFPDLEGAYVYGDYETGKIWALHNKADKKNGASPREIADSRLRIITFGEDHNDEHLVVDYAGTIYRFEKNEAADQSLPPFPKKLSKTGLFASVADHRSAPGVVPYAVNVERWSDGAITERVLGIPAGLQIGVPGGNNAGTPWSLPGHSVVAKTFSLEMEAGKPKSRRRIETQILHRHPEGWRGYTYAWNDEGTDADLVKDGGEQRVFEIRDPGSAEGLRRQRWEFLSRATCFSCHNGRGGTTRALDTAQLNRDYHYGQVTDNQLRTLDHIGLFNSPVVKAPPVIDPEDRAVSLDFRARTYLHYNCSSCHRPNGGGLVPMYLERNQSLASIGFNQIPQRGDFGIKDARIIVPGEPQKSVLYYRMAKLGSGRMPHLVSSRVDREGIELIHKWISSQPRNNDPLNKRIAAIAAIAAAESDEIRGKHVKKLVATSEGALALMRALDRDPALAKQRGTIATHVARSNVPVHVSDLFDRFLPDELRAGNAMKKDPDQILGLESDVTRGRALFGDNAKAAACLTCHVLDGKGKDFGPPLTEVGGRLNRAQLLESLLEPSKTIPDEFSGYTLTKTDGTALVGRLVTRSREKIVMRDLTAQDHEVAAGLVKKLERLPQSLMPAGLVGAMSDQEIADLIAFLKSLGAKNKTRGEGAE